MREPSTNGKPEPQARRIRLREFQAQLAQRVKIAQESTERSINHLGLMVGDIHCLFDLPHTSEIMPVHAITTVPLTQDWYLGLSNIRGNLVGVVDFSRFLGHPATLIDAECRIVVFSHALSLHGGLLVSRVLGLRNMQDMTPVAEPDTTSDSGSILSRWTTQHYRDAQSVCWMHIDLAALVQDPHFLHIGA